MKLKLVVVAMSFLFVCKIGFSQEIQTDSLDIKIGQMLMLGIGSDTEIRSDNKMLAEIKAQKLGGVLLYEKNITKLNSVENLKKLIATLRKDEKLPLLVSIDEEGGRVNRLKQKYGFPKTVSAKYLGDIDDIDSTKYYSDIVAHNLLLLGINVNYAPVLDVHNPDNPPIGKNERAFSEHPHVRAPKSVSVRGRALARGDAPDAHHGRLCPQTRRTQVRAGTINHNY